MTPEEIQRLIQRVFRLEQEVAQLRARMGLPPATSTPPPPATAAPSPPAPASGPQPQTSTPRVPAATAGSATAEANFVGTWFARLGALAILIGAGFAFKYAIDRGLIGPALRVAIGVAVGLAFLVWGEWAIRRRAWNLFGQAVSGGGIALLYLSILAALQLYDLIAAPAAFLLLVVVTIAGGFLAIRYDSAGLAVLAVVGGFLNPFVVAGGRSRPEALYTYLVALDLAVVFLALRRWRMLDALALGGTVIAFALGAERASFGTAATFATIFFAIFTAPAFVRSFVRRKRSGFGDFAVTLPAAFIYWGFMMGLLGRDHEAWQGAFTVALTFAYLGLGFLIRLGAPEDETLSAVLFGLAATFFAFVIPIELDGLPVPTGWAIQGVLLVWLSSETGVRRLSIGGGVLLGLAFATSLGMMADRYEPDLLLVSGESLSIALQIVSLYAAALILRRPRGQEVFATAAAILANILTVFWLSFETSAFLVRVVEGNRAQAIQLALSAIWGLYAAAILVAGIALRIRWARLFSVGLFTLVLVKLALADIWFLETGYRAVAGLGIGAILLVSSLMYQRFRDFILGEEREGAGTVPG